MVPSCLRELQPLEVDGALPHLAETSVVVPLGCEWSRMHRLEEDDVQGERELGSVGGF